MSQINGKHMVIQANRKDERKREGRDGVRCFALSKKLIPVIQLTVFSIIPIAHIKVLSESRSKVLK